MKNILTIVALCLATITVAQDKNDSKDKVITEITQDVCQCVGEKNSEGLTTEQVQVQLGLCMMSSYGKFKQRLDKYMIVSIDDENSFEMLGQEVGFKMLEVCPDTFMAFAKDVIEDEINEQSGAPYKESNIAVLGTVVKLDNDQFNTLIFKGENKREYKLLWLEYFEGQELLSDLKDLKKSNLKVSYENKEMYDPKLKYYRTYKVLRKLEVLN